MSLFHFRVKPPLEIWNLYLSFCAFSEEVCLFRELNYQDGRRQVNNGRGKRFASLEDEDILKIIDDKDSKDTKYGISFI
jgi:hypothetical protein